MKLDFEAPLGRRILRGRSLGITTFPIGSRKGHSLWWDCAKRQWSADAVGGSSSHAPCRSYKAFLRHLKKHEEQLKGCEVILVSRYVGHDITAFPV